MQGPKTCARRQEKQAPDGAQWGIFSVSYTFRGRLPINFKQLATALVQFKSTKTSFPWLEAAATNLLGTSLGTYYGMGKLLPLCWV